MFDADDSPLDARRALTEAERFAWLRLIRSRRVGPSTFWRLLDAHGGARQALDALPEVARAAGMDSYAVCPEPVVQAELTAGRKAGARLLAACEPDYPRALLDLEEPPPVIWTVGRPELAARPAVALVGARNASSLGGRMALALSRDLSAAGFVVVSGLARGIDALAHTSALDGGTIAVVAGGVDVVYPRDNAPLHDSIARQGLILSDQPMGLQPQARHFPARNRLISGLSLGVVVVEAAAKSGSLITARLALDQGREVFAVPGHPFDGRAGGSNLLIRDGATLVRGADDIMEVLGRPSDAARPEPMAEPPPAPPRRPLTATAALHGQILERLGSAPVQEDQVLRDLEVSCEAASPILTELELDGQIERQPGGLLVRIERDATTGKVTLRRT